MADAALDRSTPVGLVGAGRLGATLALAMSRAGYRVLRVQRRDEAAARRLASRIPGALPTSSPAAVADAATVVFLTTPDAAIGPVADEIDWRPGQAAVHCSGASPISVLAAAQRAGAATGGMHPMQTFPTDQPPDGPDRLRGVTFGVESESPALREWLRALVGDLGGRYLSLREADRPAYHASAVMACGLMAGLVGLAAEMWSLMGKERSEAIAALAPLVASTAEEIAARGLPGALTGPYVRGDATTVARHLAAVSEKGGDIERAYAALALAALPLAREQGRLTGEGEREIESMLREALERCKPAASRAKRRAESRPAAMEREIHTGDSH